MFDLSLHLCTTGVPVSNLYCPNNKKQALPSCVRVRGPSQVNGAVPRANQALGLAALNPSALKCRPGQAPVVLPSCIQLGVDNFPDGELPSAIVIPTETLNQALQEATTQVPVSSLTCPSGSETPLPLCATISAAQVTTGTFKTNIYIPATQVTGQIVASQICGANSSPGSVPLPSCFYVPGSQLSGSINANLVGGSLGNGVIFNGTMSNTVSMTTPQVQGLLSDSLLCPSNGSLVNMPSCWNVSQSSITGNIGASLFQGTIGDSVVYNGTINQNINIDAAQVNGNIGTSVNFTGQLVGTTACNSAKACVSIVALTQASCSGTQCTMTCPGGHNVLFCAPSVPGGGCVLNADLSSSTACVYGGTATQTCPGSSPRASYATCIAV